MHPRRAELAQACLPPLRARYLQTWLRKRRGASSSALAAIAAPTRPATRSRGAEMCQETAIYEQNYRGEQQRQSVCDLMSAVAQGDQSLAEHRQACMRHIAVQ